MLIFNYVLLYIMVSFYFRFDFFGVPRIFDWTHPVQISAACFRLLWSISDIWVYFLNVQLTELLADFLLFLLPLLIFVLLLILLAYMPLTPYLVLELFLMIQARRWRWWAQRWIGVIINFLGLLLLLLLLFDAYIVKNHALMTFCQLFILLLKSAIDFSMT